MKIYRTEELNFSNLKNYTFKPNYIDLEGLRMHYVHEGTKNTDPILLLHGEPSWSYLYRHMIPLCADAGYRVIAPDLIGFGKSDKLKNVKDYSYQSHVNWMTTFIKQLDLNNITLFGQDWGALIGLRLAAENEERFSGIVISNGMLLTGDQKISPALKLWRTFALLSPWFPTDRIIDSGCLRKLEKEEKQAYKAPFPSRKYKAGARVFPRLVPVSPDDPAAETNRKAWEVLEKWNKPFLTAFSNCDPFTRGSEKYLQKNIPGSKGQKHVILKGGHFIQEDAGKELVKIILQFIRDNNLKSSRRFLQNM